MALEERTRFIQHRGKKIYLIDCESLSPAEVISLIPNVARDVRGQPLGSVLTLMHVRGLKLDNRMSDDLKQLAAGNKPYVKASAIAGLSSLQRVVYTMVKIFTRRDFQLFDTIEQAKDYLASVA